MPTYIGGAKAEREAQRVRIRFRPYSLTTNPETPPVGALVDKVLEGVLERVPERLAALERLLEHLVERGLHVQQRAHHVAVLLLVQDQRQARLLDVRAEGRLERVERMDARAQRVQPAQVVAGGLGEQGAGSKGTEPSSIVAKAYSLMHYVTLQSEHCFTTKPSLNSGPTKPVGGRRKLTSKAGQSQMPEHEAHREQGLPW